MTNKTIDDILDSIPKPKDRKNKQFEVVFDEKYGSGLLNILLKREDGFDFNVNSLLPEGYTIKFTEKHSNRCLQTKKIIYLNRDSMKHNLNVWVMLHEIGHAWQSINEMFDKIYKQYDKKKLTGNFELKCEVQRIDGLSKLFNQKTMSDKYRSLYIEKGKIYWDGAIVCSTSDMKIKNGIFPKLFEYGYSKKATIKKIVDYKL